jgi:steroid delta-isomerase-like uncharacterized protein
MPREANLATVHRVFEEVFEKGNTAYFLEVLPTNVVMRLSGYKEPFVGPAAVKAWADSFHAGFSFKITVESVLAEGEEVAVRWTNVATHRGKYNGMPATGRQMRFTAIEWFRFEDGRCVEIWNKFDVLDVVQQLGLMPSGPPPAPLMYAALGVQRVRRLLGFEKG